MNPELPRVSPQLHLVGILVLKKFALEYSKIELCILLKCQNTVCVLQLEHSKSDYSFISESAPSFAGFSSLKKDSDSNFSSITLVGNDSPPNYRALTQIKKDPCSNFNSFTSINKKTSNTSATKRCVFSAQNFTFVRKSESPSLIWNFPSTKTTLSVQNFKLPYLFLLNVLAGHNH